MNIHNVYRPFLRYFRTKRMLRFWQQFQVDAETHILDVGGDPFNWSLLNEKPKLVFANVYRRKGRIKNWVIADGRHLPFGDGARSVPG